MTRVLGIEGTAWAASVAIYDSETDEIRMETDAYYPESGGIHPREAAEHMREAIPAVIEQILAEVESPIDAIAFSRGPGLGPCLRLCGAAARSLAGMLDIPLVGVNHMIAHLEIGRHRSGFSDPVCLNASGANAHVLAYHEGRYRVLGETMDTGVGNALDKFTRHVGWSHPGGPKVEEAAHDGEYLELPYVVKGMDFSFSGIMSAAKYAYDDGKSLADICFSLEETIFAMLGEVSERALSLTGSDEFVLGGGVAQNARLQSMLAEMCQERGASFFVPEDRFLRDNAGMIALLGAQMVSVGDRLPLADSRVLPGYRPDDVAVTWRSEAIQRAAGGGDQEIRGAEAIVEIGGETVRKRRVPKRYRHPALDDRLRRERTAAEARLTSEARRNGVPTPVITDMDPVDGWIQFQRVGECDLQEALTVSRVRSIGRYLAVLHGAGFVHGDVTTRNVRVNTTPPSPGSDTVETVLIDFGLGFYSDDIEDYAMDLHVFSQSLAGTATNIDALTAVLERGYVEEGDERVISRLREIEQRGRYQSTD